MPIHIDHVDNLAGFVAESGTKKKGEQVQVLVSHPGLTSDEPIFHIYASQIGNQYLRKANVPVQAVHSALILSHTDGTADIYVNEVQELARIKINRNVQKGEVIYTKDVDDISHLKFQNIEIKEDDIVIYLFRSEWKFALYFDFTREVNLDELYQRLGKLRHKLLLDTSFTRLQKLEVKRTEDEAQIAEDQERYDCILFTEGSSDITHLEHAQKLFAKDLNIYFSAAGGDDWLLKTREMHTRRPNSDKVICLFDRDNPSIVERLLAETESGKNYQELDNNVYSFLLPVPAHRGEKDGVSIELYYQDEEITRQDNRGYRLYLSDEFDPKNYKLKSDTSIHTSHRKPVKNGVKTVLDSEVFGSEGNIALPKQQFADYIQQGENSFNDFSMDEFEKIFKVIREILSG